MNREQLERQSTTQLCALLGINYDYFLKYEFTREQLIEMILTPNN